MDELVFKSQKGTPVTNSLLVAQKFGKRHADVIRAIEGVMSQTPEIQSQRNFALSEYNDTSGKSNPLYIMTKDGFSAVVLGFTGEQAIKFRWDFIEAFNKMEEVIRSGDYQVPATFREALLLAAQQQEQIEAQQKQLEAQRPAVDFAEHVSNASNAISLRDFAKLLCNEKINIGQNRLFVWMRANKYLMKDNMPYQEYIDKGYFKVIEQTFQTAYGGQTSAKTLVTGKGQIYFTEKLRKQEEKLNTQNSAYLKQLNT
jgi:anti-repressor protein